MVSKRLAGMSSDDARVITRTILPGDRAAWDKLFQEYRAFYTLPFDPSVLLFESFRFAIVFRSLKFGVLQFDAPSRFMTQFGVGCFRRLLYLSTFPTLAVCSPVMRYQEP